METDTMTAAEVAQTLNDAAFGGSLAGGKMVFRRNGDGEWTGGAWYSRRDDVSKLLGPNDYVVPVRSQTWTAASVEQMYLDRLQGEA